MDMNYGLVDPMEVFAAMTASLLEKQPVPFNPIYAIKPTPAPKLKIGGKPPREVFYRDTLTYMTKLPPPVQPKICTCQYLCTGAPAAIICHSCSIYDPSRSAFYCERCFPVRHPWHRVPHLFTTIENDESIEHTFKIAHRVAEAKRYENEGKGILNRLRQEIPKLEYVADDEKIDNDVRAYGRRMVAVQAKLLELQAALRQDIQHGDEHRRANLYSREDSAQPETTPPLQLENNNPRSTNSRRKLSTNSTDSNTTSINTNNTSTSLGPLKLAELRNLPFFDSEPLFTDLVENEGSFALPLVPVLVHTPEHAVVTSIVPMYVPEGVDNINTEDSLTHVEHTSDVVSSSFNNINTTNNTTTPNRIRVSFVRQDSTDSTGSMTISPMNDTITHNTYNTHNMHGNSFFRENTATELDTIQELSIDNNISTSADEYNEELNNTHNNTQHTHNNVYNTHSEYNNVNISGDKDNIDHFVDNFVEDDPSEHIPTHITHNTHNIHNTHNTTHDILSNDENTVSAEVNNNEGESRDNHDTTQDTDTGYLNQHNINNINNISNTVNTNNTNANSTNEDLKKVLSGISFTSVAHTDIDSVHSNSNHSNNSDNSYEQNRHNYTDTNSTNELTRYMSRSMYSSDLSTLSSSSVNIQRMFKGYIGRRTVSKMLTTRLVRVFSPEVGRDYYYDKISGASMWEPPKQLQADHLDELQYVAEATPSKLWACKRDCPRRKKDRITRKVLAKIVITAFARCILARNRIKRRADEVYRRVWDAESSTYYYAQVLSGETSWVKSKVYINPSSEPPVYSDSGIADSVANMNSLQVGSQKYSSTKKGSVKVSASSKRISPRMNRVF